MNNTEYNGWTNWETWQIPLWIDNDEGDYLMKRRLLNHRSFCDANCAEQIARQAFPDGTPDMSPGDMERVNWTEIASHWEDERAEMKGE